MRKHCTGCWEGTDHQHLWPQAQDSVQYSLRERGREVRLVEAIARSEDLGRVCLGVEGIGHVDEAIQTITVVVADGDESGGDAARYTNGVLNIEVLDGR